MSKVRAGNGIRVSVRIRAGWVWIFQIRFDSVQFSISSTRFRFFSVSVYAHHHNATVSQCENTKTESINFDKNFHLKHTDRPC